MSRKRKNLRVKNLIRKRFQENYEGDGVVHIIDRVLQNGRWHCTWRGNFDFPEGFDDSIRDGVKEEIKPYCEQKYNEVVNSFRQCFGEVQHQKGFSNRFDKDEWYTLTCYLPPYWIGRPDIYKFVHKDENKCKQCHGLICADCDNREEILVQPARMLTEEEISVMIEELKKEGTPVAQRIIKEIQLEVDLVKKGYFKFVGGSPFIDECWATMRYAGINMWGEFSFPAVGEFVPKEQQNEVVVTE